ncbi:MAG: cell division protein FtsB [Porticoccaceae bacterium]|nr:cell division protein FtsB [Porticoccaceae bacterium]
MRWLFIGLVFLLLVFQYRLWFGEGSFAQQVQLSRQVEQQKSRNALLAERNRILAEEVEGLREDPGAIEERARTDLGMIKEDESFFLVLEKRREVKQPKELPPPPPVEEDEPRDAMPVEIFSE